MGLDVPWQDGTQALSKRGEEIGGGVCDSGIGREEGEGFDGNVK